jgi:Transposase DDE domain group 1/Family of unknown function (DUF6441)
MKLTATITRSVEAGIQAELRDIERAVATGIREAGRGLRTELRRQVASAGLGQRLANSWRDKHYANQTDLTRPNKRVIKFYNGRGTAEQHIKEGKNAIRWTRLSCHAFRHNAVQLQLHALAYNLANFLRTLALPTGVEHWSLTTLREKLVKIGARIVRHGRYIVYQLAEVAVSRALFTEILRRIERLRLRPPPVPA